MRVKGWLKKILLGMDDPGYIRSTKEWFYELKSQLTEKPFSFVAGYPVVLNILRRNALKWEDIGITKEEAEKLYREACKLSAIKILKEMRNRVSLSSWKEGKRCMEDLRKYVELGDLSFDEIGTSPEEIKIFKMNLEIAKIGRQIKSVMQIAEQLGKKEVSKILNEIYDKLEKLVYK